MKHLFSTWAILLFALFIVVPNSFAAKWKAQHIVLIGLDGWGAYSVEKADIPNIKNVMANGAYTLKKRSALPSSSAINWASMFMGAGPELHGYTEWGSKTPDVSTRYLMPFHSYKQPISASGEASRSSWKMVGKIPCWFNSRDGSSGVLDPHSV